MVAAFPALLLTYPDIDPVLIEIGPLAIRWYALSYIAGIVLGWWFVVRMLRSARWWNAPVFGARPPLAPADADDFIVWATVGVILGGRLGYIFFYGLVYEPDYYADPLNWLMVWQGGMAFHGGMIGMILAVILFSRRRGIDMLRFGDLIAIVAPIGLFFGRIANFINGELYGRVTDSPLGMIFPYRPGHNTDPGPLPRHASQLYEAALEGLLLFAILWILIARFRLLERRGGAIGVFLVFYGMARAIVEYFFRDSDQMVVASLNISMGTTLSLPMIVTGVLFWVYGNRGVTAPAMPAPQSGNKPKRPKVK